MAAAPGQQASTSSGTQQGESFTMPYSMTAAYGEARFDEVYQKALLRKRLFKEYVIRHRLLERLNEAIEALYDCDVLPEEPMDFVVAYLKAPPPNRPTSAGRSGVTAMVGQAPVQPPQQ